MDHTLSNLK